VEGSYAGPTARSAWLSPFSRWFGLGVLLALIAHCLCLPGKPLETFEYRAADLRFRVGPPRPLSEDVVIVGVDDKSVSSPELGRWPWRRQWHARLVRALMRDRPRAIGFDVLFTEASSAASDDRELAEATAESGCVVYAAYVASAPAGSRGNPVGPRWTVRPGIVLRHDRLPRVSGVTPPVPSVSAAAAGKGIAAFLPDRDGVTRRLFLLFRDVDTGGFDPVFPLAVAVQAQGWDYGHMRFDLRRAASLAPGHTVPLGPDGAACLDFGGPSRQMPCYSFVDVIRGHVPAGAFSGKVVLVGMMAAGLRDFYPTPTHRGAYGVEINAQAVDNLLHSTFLRPVSSATSAALTVMLGLLGVAAATSLRPVPGLGLVLFSAVACEAVSVWLFRRSGVVLPAVAPLLALAGAYAPIAVFRLRTEEAGRRRLREEFRRYVPPQVVARLDAGELQQRFAGSLRPVTALFADIRGFTSLSARSDPRRMVELLNEYLQAMTELAFDLEATMDNIMGDGVFITFNVMEDQADHVDRAAHLAVNMVSRLEQLNRDWLARGVVTEPLRIGIGLSTGEALVGHIGSDIRVQYTAVSQSVNLAARLEQLNKQLGTTILATGEFVAALGPGFRVQEHGGMAVPGHPDPVGVHEILGRATGLRTD